MSAAPSSARAVVPAPAKPARTSRSPWIIVLALLAGWIAYDLIVPPERALDARAAVALINQYRAHVSPHLRGTVVCRFHPSCSLYGRESIARRGLLVGGLRTARRIARCGPWTPAHTYDPP